MNRWKSSLTLHVLTASLLLVMAVTLLWPIAATVQGGFLDTKGQWTLQYFVSVFHDPVWMAGLANSLRIALAVTLLCLLVTLPLAVLAVRHEFPGRTLFNSLMLVPLVLPPFVGAIGLKAILGRYGAINALLHHLGLLEENQRLDLLGDDMPGGRLGGVILLEVLHFYPILYLNLTAALANLDPTLDEAARIQGAGPLRRFFRLTLPMILPGLFAGAAIVYIGAFTELGTPLMFDYDRVTPVHIFWGLQEVQTNPRAFALVVIMLIVAVLVYLLGKHLLGRSKTNTASTKASIVSQASRLSPWARWLASGAFALLIGLALLPHLGVLFSSIALEGSWYDTLLPAKLTGSHFVKALTHDLAAGSIRNSLIYASLAMLLAMGLGLAISWLNVRCRATGAWLLDSLAMLPLAVPGLVMAFGYVAVSLRWPMPPLASFFQQLGWPQAASLCQVTGQAPNPLIFLVIAYAIRRLPYVVRSATAGLEQTSEQLEEAAATLGASLWTRLRRITIPLIAANLIAGGILAFAFAMLEVSDSLILAQKQEAFPITRAIYTLFERLGDGPYIASAMGVWGMIVLTLTLVGTSVLIGRKMGAIFKA